MPTELLHFEQGPIRPPSEAGSLLVRLTRNCPWNRCLFCPIYKSEKFSRRNLEDINNDISAMAETVCQIKLISKKMGFGGEITRPVLTLIQAENPHLFHIAYWLYNGAHNVFLQDGDSLHLPLADLVEILQNLKLNFPTITRITTYARSKTLLKFSVADLQQLKENGLSRIHVGLESGNDKVLELMKKGVTGEQHIEAGLRVKTAGLSLSWYVLLGLGGHQYWREHALDTANAINRVSPDYIRIRTLAVHPYSPLYQLFTQGEFVPLSDDQLIREEFLLIENLQGIKSNLISDHILNLLEEVQGKLPQDQLSMLDTLGVYLDWPEAKRELFRIGRRTGYFKTLSDLDNEGLCRPVKEYYRQLIQTGISIDDHIQQLMLRFI